MAITDFFNIPDTSCYFSSCSFVSSVGTTTSQGTANSLFTIAYSGTGSSATITFTINTAMKIGSSAYYISCLVPAYTSTSTMASSSAIYVYSSSTVSYAVTKAVCSYSPTTPTTSFSYSQNYNGGSYSQTILTSSFITPTGGSTCELPSCTVLDSTGGSQSYLTMAYLSSTTYTLTIQTSTLSSGWTSSIFEYQCTDIYSNT